MKGVDCEFAYGRSDGYLVVPGDADVRLSRFPVHLGERGLAAALAKQVARNLIVYQLGRGPGRPPLQPEIDAATALAKADAEAHEAGRGVPGQPRWPSARPKTPTSAVLRFLDNPPAGGSPA